MLALIRHGRQSGAASGGIPRLAESAATAQGAVAAALLSIQQGASRKSLTHLFNSLQLLDPAAPATPLRAAFSSLCAAPPEPSLRGRGTSAAVGPVSGDNSLLSWRHGHYSFVTSATRRQDDAAAPDAAAVPLASVNPLQGALLGRSNPLSAAVPQAAGPPRDRIARAVLRNARISPQKLNDFAAVIRKLHVDEAMVQCQISVKKAAKLVHKLLQGAKANGSNNHGLDGSRMFVEHAIVTKASMKKRSSMHGRGRSGILHKRRSHMTIILRELDLAQQAPRRVTRFHRPLLQRGRK